MTSWTKKKFERTHKDNPYAKALRSRHLRQQIMEQSEPDKKQIIREELQLEEDQG